MLGSKAFSNTEQAIQKEFNEKAAQRCTPSMLDAIKKRIDQTSIDKLTFRADVIINHHQTKSPGKSGRVQALFISQVDALYQYILSPFASRGDQLQDYIYLDKKNLSPLEILKSLGEYQSLCRFQKLSETEKIATLEILGINGEKISLQGTYRLHRPYPWHPSTMTVSNLKNRTETERYSYFKVDFNNWIKYSPNQWLAKDMIIQYLSSNLQNPLSTTSLKILRLKKINLEQEGTPSIVDKNDPLSFERWEDFVNDSFPFFEDR